MKRLTAIFICLVMMFQIAPLGSLVTADDTTEYYAEWKVGTITIYADPNNTIDSQFRTPSQFPDTFTVRYEGVINGTEWYYATDVYWSWEEYNEGYRYVKASDLNILGVVEPEISYGEIESGVGNFSVSVDGAPTDAKLDLSVIPESEYDWEGINNNRTNDMSAILGAYDIRIMRNGAEWQPEEGNPVTVSMSAASWGLFTGDRIHLLHVHEDENGEKTYQRIGPLYVENGYVSFETDKFSDYYAFKGSYTQTVGNEDHNIYLEPGTSITIEPDSSILSSSSNEKLSKDSGSANINNNSMTISASSSAQIGETAQFIFSWTETYLFFPVNREITITVTIRDRTAMITELLANPIMIAIRDLDSASFPSEPTRTTTGTYFHIKNEDGDDIYCETQTDQLPTTSSTNFYATASKYLNTSMVNSSAWMTDVNGELIYGVVDALGKETLNAFKDTNGNQTVDWDQIAQKLATYNDNQNNNNNKIAVSYNQETSTGFSTYTVYLTMDESKTIASYGTSSIDDQTVYWDEFEMVPYVIKHQDNVWHVDVALVRGDSYQLGYDINLTEYTLVGSTIALPDAVVYVENPNDDDTTIEVTLADWNYTDEINVINNDGTTGTISFKGWWTSPTATTDDTLYKPGDTITLSQTETKLYAIWTVSESLQRTENTFTIYNTTVLPAGVPMGSRLPVYGDEEFVKFTFEISLPYSESEFGDVIFTLNHITGKENDALQWASVEATLKDIQASPDTYKDYITINANSIVVEVYSGEAFRFSEVPVYTDNTKATVYSFNVTQTITEYTEKYSTQENANSTTQTKVVAMSEAQATDSQFYVYYFPPVVGLAVTATGGAENEAYIFTVDMIKDSAGNNVNANGENISALFADIKFVVPAGSTVTIAGLASGTYVITRNDAWDTIYDGSNSYEVFVDSDGGEATFTFALDGSSKYIYGHGFGTN